MKTERIDPDQLEVGQYVTAWFLPAGNSGQGGRIIDVEPDFVLLSCGEAHILEQVVWDSVHHWDVEVAHEATECLNYSDECSGPVDMWYPGSGHKSWPRCTFHGEQRLVTSERSLERYADSDVVPDWFDPTYAGESWDED